MIVCSNMNVDFLSYISITKTVRVKEVVNGVDAVTSDQNFQLSGVVCHIIALVCCAFLHVSLFFAIPMILCLICDVMEHLGLFKRSDSELTEIAHRFLRPAAR